MRGLAGLIFGLCLVTAGCATAPPSPEAQAANDPYEAFNRQALKRNAKIDKYFVIPTVAVYFVLVPEAGRRGVHNLLGNLALPTIFVNDMLQGDFSRAGKSLWRLAVNSTLGLGGLFDPASKMGIPGHGEDFGRHWRCGGARDLTWCCPFWGPAIRATPPALRWNWPWTPPTRFTLSSIFGGWGPANISPCWT